MVITNKKGLPKAMENACIALFSAKHNKPGTLSATTLKSGVREIILTDRYWDNIERDISEMTPVLIGTAIHSVLEAHTDNTEDIMAEEQFTFTVGDITVTGRLDGYDVKNKVIYDYKSAAVWKKIYNDFEDWKFQGLVYTLLLNKAGYEVNECKFIMMFKDWSPTKASTDTSYPQFPCDTYTFKPTLNDIAEIEETIKTKVEEYTKSLPLPDEELPLCTEKERWTKPTTYAVMKKGRKTALRVLETKADAEKYLSENGGDHIEERKGSDGKCENYCICNKFCPYWKEHYAPKSE